MRNLGLRRCFILRFVEALLCVTLACCVLTGCSNNLSESNVLSKLEAAGLTVERLDKLLLTNAQRQRIESEPEMIFSIRVSDADGHSQTMTLVGFDHDWKAENALGEGVPGFAVRNWLFAGVVSAPEIQRQIISALQ